MFLCFYKVPILPNLLFYNPTITVAQRWTVMISAFSKPRKHFEISIENFESYFNLFAELQKGIVNRLLCFNSR